MTIGTPDGHFFYVPILRHSLSGPAVPLLFCPSLTFLSFLYCSVLFCPSRPDRESLLSS